VGAGDQVVLGVLGSFGVGPLVEGQAGGGFEEATLGAVAGDELGCLFPGLQIDEDRLVPSLLVDGHSYRGDGLALSRRDLQLGVVGEAAGDRYGVHFCFLSCGLVLERSGSGERRSVRGARRAEEKFWRDRSRSVSAVSKRTQRAPTEVVRSLDARRTGASS